MEEHMKTVGRSIAIMTVLAFAQVAACQTIDGACWLPDSQGQGVGAGGPIVPAGAGGYGDVPTGGGGYGAGYVPCPEEEPTPLGEHTCAPVNWGGNCHAECQAYGAICYPVVENYITKRQNKLWKCRNCKPGRCWYIDPTDPKSGCSRSTGIDSKPLCWGK